jgi:hypothetical protein
MHARVCMAILGGVFLKAHERHERAKQKCLDTAHYGNTGCTGVDDLCEPSGGMRHNPPALRSNDALSAGDAHRADSEVSWTLEA